MFSREVNPFTGRDKPLSREKKLVVGLAFCVMGLVLALGIDVIAKYAEILVAGS